MLNKVNPNQTAYSMCELAKTDILKNNLTEKHIGAFLGKLGENQDIDNMIKLATTLGNKLGSSFETFLVHCKPQELTIINISKILTAITDGNKSNVNLSIKYVEKWCNEDLKNLDSKVKQAHAEGIVNLAKAVQNNLTDEYVEAFIKYFQRNPQNSIKLGLGYVLKDKVTEKRANQYFKELGQKSNNVARTMALYYEFFSQAGVSLECASLLGKAVEFGKGLRADGTQVLLELFSKNKIKLTSDHADIVSVNLADNKSTAKDINALLELFDKANVEFNVNNLLDKVADDSSGANSIKTLLDTLLKELKLEQKHVGIVLNKLGDNKSTAKDINALLQLFEQKQLKLEQKHVGIVLNKLVDNKSTAKDINALLQLFEKKGLQLTREHVDTLLKKLKDDQSEEDIKQLGNTLVKIAVYGLTKVQSQSLSNKISSSTNVVDVDAKLQQLENNQDARNMVELAKELGYRLTVDDIGAFLNKLAEGQSGDDMAGLAEELGYRLTGDHVEAFLNKLAANQNTWDVKDLIETLGNKLTEEHIEILVSKLVANQE